MCVKNGVSFSDVDPVIVRESSSGVMEKGGLARVKPTIIIISNNINKMRSLPQDKLLLRHWGNSAC